MTNEVQTPRFRAAYVATFKPKRVKNPKPGQQPKYGVTMLFDAEADLSPLLAAVNDLMTEKFGADKTKWPKGWRKPFRDAKEKAGEYEGFSEAAVYINATSNGPVPMVDEKNQDIIEERKFYSGCYAHAFVNAFWYDVDGNKGVSFGVNAIQKLADGKPLGNTVVDAKSKFSPVAGAKVAAKGAAGIFDDDA